jgi:RNA-binding protein 15
LGWISKAELEHEFDRFGAIRRIDYRADENYAYIQYDSIDAAIAACNEMRGSRLGGHKLQVDFADAALTSQPKERKVTYTPPQGYKSNRRYEQQRGSVDHREELRGSGRQQLDYEDINDFELPSYEPVRDSRDSYDDLLYTGRYKSETVGPRRQSVAAYHSDISRGGSHGRRSDAGQPHAKKPRLDMNDARPAARPSHQQRIQNTKLKRHPSSVSPALRRLSAPAYQRTRHSSVQEDRRKSKEISKGHPVSRIRAHSDSRSYNRPKSRTKGSLQSRSQSFKETKQEKQDKKNKKESKPVEEKRGETPATTKPTSAKTESLSDLAKRFAVAWKGQLQLKTTAFSVRMHLIAGDPSLADQLLRGSQGQTIANTSFSVTQRLRLEQTKLEEVNRKVNSAGPSGHCMLLAQPGPAPATVKDQKQDTETDETDSQAMKHLPLRNLITYLRAREAAGIVMLSAPQSTGMAASGKDMSGIMYIFPPCIFSQQHLTRIAPSLPSEPSKEDHLLVIVVRNTELKNVL